MHPLLEDAWVAEQVDLAVAPYQGTLSAADIAWMRDQLAETLATDGRAAQMLRRAQPAMADESGEVRRDRQTYARHAEVSKQGWLIVPSEAELVLQGVSVVQHVARKIARRLGGCVPLDDLVGIGNLALLDLARTYDPTRATFATYVSSKLRWLILDAVRRETHGRVAAARATAVAAAERFVDTDYNEGGRVQPTTLEDDQATLAAFLSGHAAALAFGLVAPRPANDATDPEEQLARAELDALLRSVVGRLPDPKRSLVERHYYGGERFDAIARDLGISKSWASRLHAEAILEMAQAAREMTGRAPAPQRRS